MEIGANSILFSSSHMAQIKPLVLFLILSVFWYNGDVGGLSMIKSRGVIRIN